MDASCQDPWHFRRGPNQSPCATCGAKPPGYDPEPLIDALVAGHGLDVTVWSYLSDAHRALRRYVPDEEGLMRELRAVLRRAPEAAGVCVRERGFVPPVGSEAAIEQVRRQATERAQRMLKPLKDAIVLLEHVREEWKNAGEKI